MMCWWYPKDQTLSKTSRKSNQFHSNDASHQSRKLLPEWSSTERYGDSKWQQLHCGIDFPRETFLITIVYGGTWWTLAMQKQWFSNIPSRNLIDDGKLRYRCAFHTSSRWKHRLKLIIEFLKRAKWRKESLKEKLVPSGLSCCWIDTLGPDSTLCEGVGCRTKPHLARSQTVKINKANNVLWAAQTNDPAKSQQRSNLLWCCVFIDGSNKYQDVLLRWVRQCQWGWIILPMAQNGVCGGVVNFTEHPPVPCGWTILDPTVREPIDGVDVVLGSGKVRWDSGWDRNSWSDNGRVLRTIDFSVCLFVFCECYYF